MKTFIFAAIVAATACNPGLDSESDVKTLDNFAAGKDLTTNSCGSPNANAATLPDHAVTFDQTVSPAEQPALKASWLRMSSSLPGSVRAEFLAMGGTVVMTKSVDQYCEGPELKEASGCINHAYDAAAKKLTLTIYQDASETSIRHAGIRAFGFLYGQIMWRYETIAGSVELRSDYPTVVGMKVALADQFLRDMVAKKMSLAAFEGFFGRDELTSIVSRSRSADGPVMSAAGIADDKIAGFSDHVFAEAFDSYYCDTSPGGTRASFQQNFSGLFAKYKLLMDGIEMLHLALGFGLQNYSENGYTYYPSFGGQTNGGYGGYGAYGNEYYAGSYTSPNGYYNVYKSGGTYSYSQLNQYSDSVPSPYVDNLYSSHDTMANSPTSMAPNQMGD